MTVLLLACLAVSIFCCRPGTGDGLRIAVASNFTAPLERIAGDFERTSGHRVTIASSSTGKHYAQIRNGAPFDLFFAADRTRPARLEREGHAVPGSRFTYAIGRLVLWSPIPDLVDEKGAVLDGNDFRYLAIANPDLAPYGRAAREVLEGLGIWNAVRSRTVMGENIGQAFAYVRSGNAELGFVALSQIRSLPDEGRGSFWLVPRNLHTRIEQQAVVLVDSRAGREFGAFVQGNRARATIVGFGYDVP